MHSINRSSIKVKPKQPFIDWINSTGEDNYTLQQLTRDNAVILLPEFYSSEDTKKYLRKVYSEIFEYELWSWITDENLWPEKRDWKVFQDWFEVEMSSEVYDMSEENIDREEA